MKIEKIQLEWFTGKLDAPAPLKFVPFAFVRYGDGEVNAMLGVHGHNCDQHTYFPDLGEALRITVEQPRAYVYALGPKVVTRENRIAHLGKAYLSQQTIIWHDSEVFLKASLAGTLKPFIDALRHREILLIGTEHHEPLSQQLPVRAFVRVPAVNAWLEHDRILNDILRQGYQCDTLIYCAGMTTKALIWELYPHLGRTHAQIDCGSVFDMYLGKLSRSYARKLDAREIERLREMNF